MALERTLFDAFGGIRQMAEELEESPSTVQSWKTVGRVPASKQPKVLQVAQRLGLPIVAENIIFPLRHVPLPPDSENVVQGGLAPERDAVPCNRAPEIHRDGDQ